MSDTATRDDVIQRVMDQVKAVTADLSEAQRAQSEAIARTVATEMIDAKMAESLARDYRAEPDPESDAALRGTVYGRLGMSMADVELVHDVIESSRAVDPRGRGVSEVTRNIVAASRAKRAMDTAESGFGAELVADAVYVPKLWDVARADYGAVLNLVEQRQMGGPVEKQPVLGNVPDMILAGETTGAIGSASEYGTQKVASSEITLTAQKLLAHYNYSGEMVEDSIVPFVGVLNRGLALTMARTADKLLLNGDTTNAGTGNINEDDANPDDTKYFLAADGIRHAFLVDNTANAVDASASLTYEKIVNLPTLMIDRTRDMHWGRPASAAGLVYFCNPELEDEVLTLPELMTYQQFGMNATVFAAGAPLNSEFVRIGRNPMISTIAIKQTAADGKVDTADNGTKGTIIALNPAGLIWGVRRQAMIETERRPGTDQWRIILSTRVAVGRYTPTGAASGIEWTAGLYNI